MKAINTFKERPNLQFTWLRYIPEDISDSFMKPAEEAFIEELKAQRIILCSSGSYHLPTTVLMEPYCGENDAPLIPEQFFTNRFYISPKYDLNVDKARLRRLGVAEMSWDDLISGLGNLQYDASFLRDQDESWHERVCSHLVQAISGATDLQIGQYW